MKTIQSFCVDHDTIVPGIYVSRVDGDVTTFDLRTRKPNDGDYMSNLTMHSVEHMFATYVRNSEIGQHVIYFGPMGCRTGFYLLTRDLSNQQVLEAVKNTLQKIVDHKDGMFGATRKECGNYLELDLDTAKQEAARFLSVLTENPQSFTY